MVTIIWASSYDGANGDRIYSSLNILVSFPIEIYSATKSGAVISFPQIHEPSGKPVKYEKVVPGIGRIDIDDIVKGHEMSKGHYALLDEEEVKAVKLESERTSELLRLINGRSPVGGRGGDFENVTCQRAVSPHDLMAMRGRGVSFSMHATGRE